jgi:hypothetical protein
MRWTTFGLAAALFALPVSSLRAEEARYREMTIPAGTTLSIELRSRVASNASRVEDPVSAVLRRSIVVDGVRVIPAGAALSGVVIDAQRSGKVKGRGRVAFRLTSIQAYDERYRVQSASIARKAPGTKRADATKIGIGAGAGALVGALADGGKGAAIGSAAGAGAGTGVVLATRGKEVQLGPGARLVTRLTAPLTVRVPR